ncbi:MAG: cellobiose phosphorylase [Clostridiaceae bacterium]
MSDNSIKYTLDSYGKKSTFSSFLPGISGTLGIAIWCFYVNRGQGIVSFGLENKDNAIMEFYPAHQAYQNVKRTGFRTFIKKNGRYIEPFSREEKVHKMDVYMNSLAIEEVDEENEIITTAEYYTLPGEPLGALVRRVTIRNIAKEAISLELLDGMPAIIPFGVDMMSMKSMGQTVKAWMQVEDVEEGVPCFRVRVSTKDTADVCEILGGNFSFACLKEGARLKPIVDPELVFSYDTSLEKAQGFIDKGIKGLLASKQITNNQLPCSFYGFEKNLEADEEISIYQVIGQVENKKELESFFQKNIDFDYFESKKREAESIIDELTQGIKTTTGSKEFDAYCRYTYLDNILRGGYPIILGKDKIFYAYSRKHGDLERDYNYFSMLPEYYSQGNGNYRDVNQNRRCDVFFAPYLERENIKTFYSLIQLDGYNPLVIDKVSYIIQEKELQEILTNADVENKEKIIKGLKEPFTPGALYKKLLHCNLGNDNFCDYLFNAIMEASSSSVNGTFGEGYWSDHWTYNLDLIDNYLNIFPEKERELLFNEEYTYFLSQININKRHRKYIRTENGIRQYNALDEESKRDGSEKHLRANFGKGEVIYSSLLEKLILLSAIKVAALDPYAMGIEMEGGKPGWYDALNGLPGLFGSSMAEAYELLRNLSYTIEALKKYPGKISLLEPIKELIINLHTAALEEKEALMRDMEVMGFWNRINDIKERYREETYQGISGSKAYLDSSYLIEVLELWRTIAEKGIEKAIAIKEGVCPTYFFYEVTSYEETTQGIMPLHFEVKSMPIFLEGPVRYLKLNYPVDKKKELYTLVKNSDLYDKKLSMYKVNASLSEASYEIGRAKAFTPGWLENESIWLHMEYKYFLELLRSGLYREFIEDFGKAAVPFLKPEVYGRSIYENSSFIASSKNPDESIHGKGFVARLSGSTVELINIWQIMFFGLKPFSLKDGKTLLTFAPTIPYYLIDENKRIEAMFLGLVKVNYILSEKKSYIPGEYRIEELVLYYKNGEIFKSKFGVLMEKEALDVRNGFVDSILIKLT